MSPTNIIRSLTYIEEKTRLILLDARGGARAAASHEKVDIKEFWRFYKEIIPYLETYAAQINIEQISHHTRLFIQYRDAMEAYQKRRTWFWYIFLSGDRFRDDLKTEEYIQLLQDICNNISNFIYQVKINAEEAM